MYEEGGRDVSEGVSPHHVVLREGAVLQEGEDEDREDHAEVSAPLSGHK